ncbi:MAG: hypothetical protein A3A30_02410 [Candidatus Terrybacteria bacterium RIFCSPLOWO2_01_FULL_48_14]|nr:MAG: hypothetical protein A3A30_02410 [Candidatus Terrybacteria bacterium RIFCSPLOWO2_01_FULL_48_14]
MRKEVLATNELYHVYNRGVEKRKVFLDQKDLFRALHSIFELNNAELVANSGYHCSNKDIAESERKPRKLLVEIIAFCLMPNHFHFLLRQLRDNGISLFMQKFGTGYAQYFNKKHDRSGTLFEGRFRAIHVTDDEYLLHLSRYIHLNPVELAFPGWKEKGIENTQKLETFLNTYRWSSYLDYIGTKNFPSVTQREFLLGYFKNPREYKKFVLSWTKQDLSRIADYTLE